MTNNTIQTAMCIMPTVDWFGRSAGPQPVYCAVTLAVLGKTDGTVSREGQNFRLQFGGVEFLATPTRSSWYVLQAVCS